MLNSFKIGLSSLYLQLFRLSSEKLLKGFLISVLETVENLYKAKVTRAVSFIQ